MINRDKVKSFLLFFSKKKVKYSLASISGFAIGILFFIFLTPNFYKQQEPIIFEIKNGETLSQVISNLAKKKIIPSKFNMHLASLFFNASKNIKAGQYKITNGLNYFELLSLLLKGMPEDATKITLQEGIWQHNLAAIFKRELGLDSSKLIKLSNDTTFLNSLGLTDEQHLEGFLLPETYNFAKSSTEKTVLRKLKREMDKLFNDSTLIKIKQRGYTKKDILTVASLVEAESNYVSEFATIAGVYFNRLKRGMKLQADPTIQYLIRNSKRYNRILYKDLEIDSPYNTYKYLGLPPSPINNPGKAAVLAAINPEKHSYYYFVANGKGGHSFSKSYSEHLRNVYKYRAWRRRR